MLSQRRSQYEWAGIDNDGPKDMLLSPIKDDDGLKQRGRMTICPTNKLLTFANSLF